MLPIFFYRNDYDPAALPGVCGRKLRQVLGHLALVPAYFCCGIMGNLPMPRDIGRKCEFLKGNNEIFDNIKLC